MSEGAGAGRTSFRPPALYLIASGSAVAPDADAREAHATLLEVSARVLAAAQPFRRNDGSLPVAICLRETFLLASQLFSLAGDLVAITRNAGASLFINGRLDIALAVGATGVHLPAHGIPARDVRAAAPHLRVGLSTHTVDDVQAAARDDVDFVVYGPVYETPSKTGFLRPRGLGELARAAAVGVPVLALGGIAVGDVAGCVAAGAKGVACIRAVFAAEDPAASTAAFLGCFTREER
ncbi:MAG TPA: thiamine phosphate synthase [Polyangia bacterium]